MAQISARPSVTRKGGPAVDHMEVGKALAPPLSAPPRGFTRGSSPSYQEAAMSAQRRDIQARTTRARANEVGASPRFSGPELTGRAWSQGTACCRFCPSTAPGPREG